MPFQPINFLAAPIRRNTFISDMLDSYVKSTQAAELSDQQKRAAQSEELANAFKNLQFQQEPQRFQSAQQAQAFKNALEEQQKNKIIKDLNNPFYGLPSGDLGQVEGLERLKKTYGENSPQYQDLQNRVNLELKNKQSLINSRDILANTSDKRASTTLGKTAQELDDINAGFMPGSNRKTPLTGEQQQILKGQYELKLQKEVTDVGVRGKSLFASNIDKTLSRFEPKDLIQYSGPLGQAQKSKDLLSAALGKPSENYLKYQKAITDMGFLVKQTRQFYGDSITEAMQDKLKALENPSTWYKDPKVALSQFNEVKDLLKLETGTYRGALKDTSEYKENKNLSPFKKESGKIEYKAPYKKESVKPGFTRLYKNGKPHLIPNNLVEEALKEEGVSR